MKENSNDPVNLPVNLIGEFNRMILGEPVFVNDHWKASYFLPEDFVGFIGHFPGHPVLAALIQTFLGHHMFLLVLKKWPEVLEVSSAKFVEQAGADDTIHVYGKPLLVGSDANLTWEFVIKKNYSEWMDLTDEPSDADEQAGQILVSTFRISFDLK